MSVRHPADSYIHLPWLPHGETRDGVSCWGLVQLVYREQLGIELPSYPHEPEAAAAIGAELQAALKAGEWQPVETPRDWDLVAMSHRLAPHHFGFWAAGYVVHVNAWLRNVHAETADQLARRGYGRIRFLRRPV